MRNTVLAAVLAATLMPATAFAQMGPNRLQDSFFGHDDRIYVNPGEMPWQAIGKLTFAGGGHCSGALVGQRVVLTSAHCMYEQGSGQVFDAPLTFQAGLHKGDVVAESGITSFWIAPEYRSKGLESISEMSKSDYAFVLLDQPIGNTVGYFAVHELSTGDLREAMTRRWQVLIQAGYSGDSDDQLTAHMDCGITSYNESTVQHDCDIMSGDSGSPIFFKIDDAYTIIAVNSAVFGGADPYNLAVDSRAFSADLARYLQRYDDFE